MRSTILGTTFALVACGGSSAPPTVGHRGATAAPAPTLADDVALMSGFVGDTSSPTRADLDRVAFVGWTADRRVVYRWLRCRIVEPDSSNHDHCDLNLCAEGVIADALRAPCESVGLYLASEPGPDAAEVDTSVAAALLPFGPLATGTALASHESGLALRGRGLHQEVAGLPPKAIAETHTTDDGVEVGVVGFETTTTTRSPDGACVASLGIAQWSDGDNSVFAAVACKAVGAR
jgi:hypothetical protein